MIRFSMSDAAPYSGLFLSFSEGTRCRHFLAEAKKQGFDADALLNDTPRLDRAVGELTRRLRSVNACVLCCHGYKANITGLWAARRLGIPVIAVSRGWTRESLKVRVYESLDRLALRFMDRVVCISEGQAMKVRLRGRRPAQGFGHSQRRQRGTVRAAGPRGRADLLRYFPTPPIHVVAAAGRLSPEKGFDVLVRAAAPVAPKLPSVGFILFGDGPLREAWPSKSRRRDWRGASFSRAFAATWIG